MPAISMAAILPWPLEHHILGTSAGKGAMEHPDPKLLRCRAEVMQDINPWGDHSKKALVWMDCRLIILHLKAFGFDFVCKI